MVAMFLLWLQAENVVLALRDLFQTVYEMKKQEIEDAKAKATAGTEGQGDGDNPDTTYQVSNGENERYITQSTEVVAKCWWHELLVKKLLIWGLFLAVIFSFRLSVWLSLVLRWNKQKKGRERKNAMHTLLIDAITVF